LADDERIAGLDLVRSCAILLVVFAHAPWANGLRVAGWIGVDLFFVLSGFLIAQMIVERFDSVRTPGALANFMLNRWLRTLPLYYLFLLVHVVMVKAHPVLSPDGAPIHETLAHVPDIFPFLIFLQNLTEGGIKLHSNWFGISWTLATEEWFYLLMPLVVWRWRHIRFDTVVLGLTVLLTLIAIGGRAWRFLGDDGLMFDDMYRRVLPLRLDTFCFGMLAYLGLRRVAAAAAERIRTWFMLGLLLCAVSVVMIARDDFDLAFLKVLSPTVVPVALALMLPAFARLRITNGGIRAALRFVSTRTYALYLSHYIVALIYYAWIAAPSPLHFLLILGIQLLIADLIYRLIERPMLRWRPRSSAPLLQSVAA
jgi:peptidoglycan/LPS O-acetylase OafA/YrhL